VGSANVTTTASGATSPTLVNLVLTANTEASYSLPSNTRGFFFKLRDWELCQFAFTANGTATTYITLPKGTAYGQDGLLATGLTIYFKTPASGQVLELLAWT
jgi:hypothetical protein